MNLSRSTNTSHSHEWSTEISCMVFVNNALLINNFSIKVGFLPTVENIVLNDIAIEQIDIFFNLFMHNSIVINKKQYEEISDKIPLENNIFMIPEHPNDQSIGVLIFFKLIAIVGNSLDIDYIKISSELGKNIIYTIDSESSEIDQVLPNKSDWWENETVPFFPWWNRSDTATYDILIDENKIYQGDILWEDIFKDELEKLKETEKLVKGKFKIISGGKDEVK